MKDRFTFDYKKGKVSGSVYSKNSNLDKLHEKLYLYFNKSNPLHTNVFPAVRLMENNLVNIMKGLLTVIKCFGTFTSGGTESILLACKTYRDYFKNIVSPEIIASTTVHCAFTKACQYFKIKLKMIDCKKDGTFDVDLLESYITKNTILIVGSTPSYNLGIIDPIDKLSKICIKYNIPLHVDACIGSFLINYLNINYDFSLEGVTSISADFHKYGHSPKGASCILYKDKKYLESQYFIDETWSGGIYATSTITGSRPGNIVALTWATVLSYGNVQYEKNYLDIKNMREYLIKEISKIKELFIIGNPMLSIIAIDSNIININLLADELKKKGWDLNVIQNPKGFHLCLTSYMTIDILRKFITNVKEIIPNLLQKNVKYSPCIYGTMQKINDNSIIKDVVTNYLHVLNEVYLNF